MKNKHLAQRTIIFAAGIFIMALGVALSVKANLGVSPISCIPYIYSLKYPLSMGTTTILFNMLLILLQILVYRKNYDPVQLVQLPVVLAFGLFTDFSLYLVSDLTVTTYFLQVVLCLVSCAVIAFGVFLEVKASLTFLAGEGLAMALSDTFHFEFGKAKIGVDSSMVIGGLLSCLVLVHRLDGIREGTIAAAVLVGMMVRFYNAKFTFLERWLHEPEIQVPDPEVRLAAIEAAPAAREEHHLVITIAREYGSGGHEIGKRIASELNLPFYDRELIRMTAEQGGFTQEYIQENEQRLTNTLLYRLYEQNYAYVNEKIPAMDALFLVQSQVLRDLSSKGPCVIVGRCADFILKANPKCFNVFVHANREFRVKHAIESYGVLEAEADAKVERTDRERKNYYRHYAGRHWRDVNNYHLTVDTSLFGVEMAAQMIIHAVAQHGLTQVK